MGTVLAIFAVIGALFSLWCIYVVAYALWARRHGR